MKIYTFILALYVLVITVMPCIDTLNDVTIQKTEIANSTSNNGQDDCDHCSPFCTCQCCASPAVFQYLVVNLNSFAFSQDIELPYTTSYLSIPFNAIWQPPKIS